MWFEKFEAKNEDLYNQEIDLDTSANMENILAWVELKRELEQEGIPGDLDNLMWSVEESRYKEVAGINGLSRVNADGSVSLDDLEKEFWPSKRV